MTMPDTAIYVLDTNILLDLFVFHDPHVQGLYADITNKAIKTIATQKTVDEFADVISRSTFSLGVKEQNTIMSQWQNLAHIINDADLLPSTLTCEDRDDQIFIDLAYSFRPSVLISKDNAVLKLRKLAAKERIQIQSSYKPL